MDGIEQLICCSVEGEVRGYKAMSSQMLNMQSDRNISQETIRDMAQRKQVKHFFLNKPAEKNVNFNFLNSLELDARIR